MTVGECILHTEHDCRRRALDRVRVCPEGEFLPGERVTEAIRKRAQHRVREFREVIRIRIVRQLEQVEVPGRTRFEIDDTAHENWRLIRPWSDRYGQHQRRPATVRIGRRAAVRHLERDGCRAEILVGRGETQGVIVDDRARAIRMRHLHVRGVGQTHLLAPDCEDVAVEVDREKRLARDSQRRRPAVELWQRIVETWYPDKSVGDNA